MTSKLQLTVPKAIANQYGIRPKEAKAKGTGVTRKNRGWTREELYEDDRGLPRGFPR